MKTKQIDERGILSAGDFLELPVRLYSRTGGFYRVVKTPDELLKFLRDHYASGAYFDVEAVWRYYLEQPGDVVYTGKIPEPKHNTQGMMPGFEAL